MFNLFLSLIVSLFSANVSPATPVSYYNIPTEIVENSSSTVEQLSKPAWQSIQKLKTDKVVWPSVTAQAAAVVDWQTGQILWQKNPDKVLTLASLTKLMTALVVLENENKPTAVLTVPVGSVPNNTTTYLKVGEKASLSDLFKILLVASSNEAAETLASYLGRDQFISLMNARAKTLGLERSNFADPSGLNPANQATLTDVIHLAQTVFQKPEVLAVADLAQGQITASGSNGQRTINFDSTNKLFGADLKILAGKTGTLDQAGFSVVSVVSQTGKRPLLVVVLGATDTFARFAEAEKLAKWAWQNYGN